MRLKVDASRVCQNSYPDNVKEKYNAKMSQRQEKIAKQEQSYDKSSVQKKVESNYIVYCRSLLLSSLRLKSYSSYENLKPAWHSPVPIIFGEDKEEKVDDFPEFSDSQRQKIRECIHGHPNTVRITSKSI